MDERRKNPRFTDQLELKVSASGGEGLCAKSENISRKGISCSIPEHIELFSKLTVSLKLEAPDAEPRKLSCDGVVVRIDPENPSDAVDEYSVAIYFTNLSPETAGVIDDYLSLKEG